MIGAEVVTAVSRKRKIPSALDLQFTSKNLDPRIIFSRASLATMMGKSGLLEFAPHNLFTFSEQFENSYWQKGLDATVTANTAVAPDGSTSADTLVESATDTYHRVGRLNTGLPLGVTGTMSFYVKQAGRRYCYLRHNWAAGAVFDNVGFDLETLEVTYTSAGYTAEITDAGDGWRRVSFSGLNTHSEPSAYLGISSAPVTSSTLPTYLGNGASGLYIWGAQLNQGSLQDYNSTTTKNLLGYTEQFDNAVWLKTGGGTGIAPVVTPNTVLAPDGTMAADTVVFNKGAGTTATDKSLISISTINLVNPVVTRHSIYIRADSPTAVAFRKPQNNGTYSQVNVTTEWQRVDVFDGVPVTASLFEIGLRGSVGVTAPDSVTVYLWGAQMSNSASLDPYVRNSGLAPVSAAYYGPRIEYDPVTGECKGLLIEPSRTNLLTYSEDFSNAAWNKGFTVISTGAVLAPNGAVAPKLVATADTGVHHIQRYNVAGVVANTTYLLSLYVKAGEQTKGALTLNGTWAAGTTADASFDLVNGTITNVDATITPVGGGWFRITRKVTTDATVSLPTFRVYLLDTVTQWAGDGVTGFYIWGAQLEAGAFPTSYIPTVASSVTRAYDEAKITGTDFSSWYNQPEGTMLVEAIPSVIGVYGLYSINTGDASQRIDVRAHGYPYLSVAGAQQIDSATLAGITGPLIAGVANKHAFAVKLNDVAVCLNGGTLGLDFVASMPTPSLIRFGDLETLAHTLGGHIRRFTYYNTRLPNATIQELTK